MAPSFLGISSALCSRLPAAVHERPLAGVVSVIVYCCSRPHSLVKLPRRPGCMLTHDHQVRAAQKIAAPTPAHKPVRDSSQAAAESTRHELSMRTPIGAQVFPPAGMARGKAP